MKRTVFHVYPPLRNDHSILVYSIRILLSTPKTFGSVWEVCAGWWLLDSGWWVVSHKSGRLGYMKIKITIPLGQRELDR